MPSNNTITHPGRCARETLGSKCQGCFRPVPKENKYPPPLLPELICIFPQMPCMFWPRRVSFFFAFGLNNSKIQSLNKAALPGIFEACLPHNGGTDRTQTRPRRHNSLKTAVSVLYHR